MYVTALLSTLPRRIMKNHATLVFSQLIYVNSILHNVKQIFSLCEFPSSYQKLRSLVIFFIDFNTKENSEKHLNNWNRELPSQPCDFFVLNFETLHSWVLLIVSKQRSYNLIACKRVIIYYYSATYSSPASVILAAKFKSAQSLVLKKCPQFNKFELLYSPYYIKYKERPAQPIRTVLNGVIGLRRLSGTPLMYSLVIANAWLTRF